MTKYPIEVFWSDEDEGYIAVVPDLPGCSAWGKTEVVPFLNCSISACRFLNLTFCQDELAAWNYRSELRAVAVPAPASGPDYEVYVVTNFGGLM